MRPARSSLAQFHLRSTTAREVRKPRSMPSALSGFVPGRRVSGVR